MSEQAHWPTAAEHDAGVHAAVAQLRDRVHVTPIMRSASLDRLLGCTALFKCEQLQRTGAFKYRGASNALASLPPGTTSVCTHSSGNHGAALAAAALALGIDAHIVMPENAVPTKVNAVRAYQGTVHFCAPTQQAREQAFAALQVQGHHAVPPYDDWRVIYGQATASVELIEQTDGLDMLLAPVGGGGLISGACLAVQAVQADIRVLAAEPEGAADAHASLLAGRRIVDQPVDTIADGLRATIGVRNFHVLQQQLESVLLVSDDEILQATERVWRHMKQLIEPSCATVVAAITRYPELFAGQRVGIILSGGNVDTSKLLAALR
ncbi:MAG: pyridoxal-phosphate dependent enzyme [Gammaproteobacteria bacterium]|nr:pyridoxal-phosphate dependent enzyme [Gammaproteobacteria bacterium]